MRHGMSSGRPMRSNGASRRGRRRSRAAVAAIIFYSNGPARRCSRDVLETEVQCEETRQLVDRALTRRVGYVRDRDWIPVDRTMVINNTPPPPPPPLTQPPPNTPPPARVGRACDAASREGQERAGEKEGALDVEVVDRWSHGRRETRRG